MTEKESKKFCEDNKFKYEEFIKCKFILKDRDKAKKFIKKLDEKYNRERLQQRSFYA